MEIYDKKIGELTIPVPWGHIAAKTWGEESDPLVVCIHGVMDNAGTFNRLLPFLPSTYYYVCIDLPGHGKSSYFPAYLPIHSINYLLVYRILTEYFQKKFIIIGHSYGGQLGFLYAQMYPDYVDKLIMLDTYTMFPVETDMFVDYLEGKMGNHLRIIKNTSKTPPLFTREDALNQLQRKRIYTEIKIESAEALLERAIVPVGDLYKFSLDQRIKNYINPLKDLNYTIDYIKSNPIQCSVLLLSANKNAFQLAAMEPFIKFLKTIKNLTFIEVDGNHDVHNDYPERVAPHIKNFLLKHKGKL